MGYLVWSDKLPKRDQTIEKLLTVTNKVFLEVQAQEQVKTSLKDENIKIFNSLDKEVDQY